jgi:hypothetical protein
LLIPPLALLSVAACNGPATHAGATPAASTPPVASKAVLQYFSDVKTALAPLLVHVRTLPAMTEDVRKTGVVSSTQVSAAGRMAFDFATARDLVGRIPVPPEAPEPVGELMQIACQLYRTSALELQKGGGARAARNAAALQQLADGLIDQVRRLLAVDHAGTDQLAIEYRYADPVPAVRSFVGPAPTSRTATVDSLVTAVEGARRALDDQTRPAASRRVASTPELATLATRLEALGSDSPEYVVTARIALLLGVLAHETSLEGRTAASDLLDMLSRETWNQAAAFPGRPVAPIGATRLGRSEVWTGGAFNGSPPPLVPAQGIGSGLPGGLPTVDGTSILER